MDQWSATKETGIRDTEQKASDRTAAKETSNTTESKEAGETRAELEAGNTTAGLKAGWASEGLGVIEFSYDVGKGGQLSLRQDVCKGSG